jgi:arginine/lysine/ornithine decarboxylase
LLEIDKEVCGDGKTDTVEKPEVVEKMEVSEEKRTISGDEIKQDIPFFKAWDREKEFVELDASNGRFAGEFINLYPPGTPIVVPGECITEVVIQKIKECLQVGLEVQGVYKAEENSNVAVSCIQ